MVRKGVQGQRKPNVQNQIKALQKRIKALEYDIVYLKLQVKPITEVRQIGFIQHQNLHSENEFDNE